VRGRRCGLARERGVNVVGPLAASAVKALEPLGARAAEAVSRSPAPATSADPEGVALIVARKHAEHLPLLQERFTAVAQKVEFWHGDDAPEVLGLIEQQVMGLVARLPGGGQRPESQPTEAAAPDAAVRAGVRPDRRRPHRRYRRHHTPRRPGLHASSPSFVSAGRPPTR
jgi:hypothetical protein